MARRTEPLEKYDNPPARTHFPNRDFAGEWSRSYGPFTSYQVNVDASGHEYHRRRRERAVYRR